MLRRREDDNEALAMPQLFGQPSTLSSSNTVWPPPVNDNQLEAAENGVLPIDSGNAPQNDDSLDLGPPPDFTQYEAENFKAYHSDIVSHDPHLNSDGEALYRFILSQVDSFPSHRITCHGTHKELRPNYVATIVDFHFCIDIVPDGPVKPVQWSFADDEPAYRGLMVHEFEGSSRREVAKGKKLKSYKQWKAKRKALGLPPWATEDTDVSGGTIEHFDSLRSSKTLRQWADEYCASPKYLKEFVYRKVLYGWQMRQIESAIRSTIRSSPYHGTLQIHFTPYRSKVYIRPDNAVSRMLSNKWLKFLSIILFIFPIIWLFKRFHSRGGGRWEVCGAAYPLKQWVGPEPEGIDSDSLPTYTQSAGPKKSLGLEEREWFRRWEGVILRAVNRRYRSSTPLRTDARGFPVI